MSAALKPTRTCSACEPDGRCPPALAAILRQHNRRLYRIARSVLHDPAEAEDVVQDAYVRALSSLDALRDPASMGAWLSRITLNEALTRLRRRREAAPLDEVAEQVPDTTASATILMSPFGRNDPEQMMVRREMAEVLERAIDRLPEHFRTVFVACDVEQMPLDEVASLLGLYHVTVKTRLFRARRLLRRYLDADMIGALASAFPCAGRRCERITQAVLARLPQGAPIRLLAEHWSEGEKP